MGTENKTIKPGVYRLVVNKALAGQRLDHYLSAACDNLSRNVAKKIISLGGVHYCGRRTRRCSQVAEAGARVEMFVDNLSLEPMVLRDDHILYRDKDIIVINKPAGMPTQPTPSRFQGTLYAELLHLLKDSLCKDLRPSIGMVQRLDLNTSGVIVFSIHRRAHKKLTEQFRCHHIDKKYWALTSGCPDDDVGVIVSQLAKRRSSNLMVSVARGGKYAETRYRVLRSIEKISLLEVKLVTGRSHQIRAHFSEKGIPLLGDIAYGGPQMITEVSFPRQMLHAKTITFVHPVSNSEVSFEASLPDDFKKAMSSLFGSLNAQGG